MTDKTEASSGSTYAVVKDNRIVKRNVQWDGQTPHTFGPDAELIPMDQLPAGAEDSWTRNADGSWVDKDGNAVDSDPGYKTRG